MTGIGIEIRVDDAQVAKAFAAAQAQTADTRPLMEQIGASLLLSTQMRFENERGPDGNPWPKSLRVTIAGGKTLRDQGHLYQSLTYNATADRVEVGSNRIYAAIHQLGGVIRAKAGGLLKFRIGGMWISKKSVKIPARPFLGVDRDDEASIAEIVGDWLQGAFQGATP
jgi:phage virion morphogenesis protein